MIEDNWEPTDEDIKWTQDHIERMQIGDTWGIADSTIRKEEDGSMNVLKASPASLIPLQRIRKVCEKIGVELNTDDAELIQDPEAAAQESAKEWVCPTSGIPIVDFNLAEPEWVLTEADSEAWAVLVRHPSDEEDGEMYEVALSPMDYHLVAGDELFFSWNGMRVLERHEIILLADDDTLLSRLQNKEVFVMPTNYGGELIPPHLRGLIFLVPLAGDEEE